MEELEFNFEEELKKAAAESMKEEMKGGEEKQS